MGYRDRSGIVGQYRGADVYVIAYEDFTESMTKTVVDTVNNTVGKCTWTQKINICGEIDNPEDECTTAVGATECADGYVTHNAKCVEPCEDGYVFESATSSKCVKKEVNAHQGVIDGHRFVCPDNKFWDVKTLSCKDKTEWTMISNVAFDECWLCKSPVDLTECLRHVTNGGSLSTRPTLKKKCEL